MSEESGLPRRRDAVHHRHPDVHEHHVGLGAADHVDRFAAVARETYHLAPPGLEDQAVAC